MEFIWPNQGGAAERRPKAACPEVASGASQSADDRLSSVGPVRERPHFDRMGAEAIAALFEHGA